jgi:hypothetical protein
LATTTDTLVILAEVTTAFVAFAAIVASLRMTLGQELTPFQKLLVHFFTESGMAAVSIAIFPLVLLGFLQDQTAVARYTIWYTLAVSGAYLVYYIRRRLRIKASTPIPSLLVMIGYAVWLPILGVLATGMFWEPSLAIVAAFCFWALFSGVVIFISFLATFVDLDKPPT